ncbi:MAG: GtrA family protein [Candidatus Celaenobacter polaris]|nr:GtrA family protein [Candidatus Celaenobacter polaris]
MKKKYLKPSMFKRFIKFTIRGLIGAVVDTTVLWFLTTYAFTTYFAKYVLAPSISFEVAILVSYVIIYFWIWNHIVLNSFKDFIRRIPKYNAAVLLSFGVKLILLNVIQQIFHFEVLICNLIALFFSGFINFFTNEKIIFKEQKTAVEDLYENL